MNYADFQFLQFEHKPNGVLLITINRPEVMNATNARLHWELTKIWGVVNDDPKTKVASSPAPATRPSRPAAT
jgi:enoyl-CoA hydratase